MPAKWPTGTIARASKNEVLARPLAQKLNSFSKKLKKRKRGKKKMMVLISQEGRKKPKIIGWYEDFDEAWDLACKLYKKSDGKVKTHLIPQGWTGKL